jgi:lipopolysaccharide heptosyltransferase II
MFEFTYKIVSRKKLAATFIIDLLGSVLFLPKAFFGSGGAIRPESVNTILVIRTAYMGDVVMTLPLLKPLKKRFPRAKISFLTASSAKDVLINNPYIDEIITYDPFWFYPTSPKKYMTFIRKFYKRSFDLVIEARGDFRDILFLAYPLKSSRRVGFAFGGGSFLLTHVVPYQGVKHKLEYHLDIASYLGCEPDTLEWGVYLTDDEKKRVRDILDDQDIRKPFIAVHPGARHALRQWFQERYALLYDRIASELGCPVVIVGSPGEKILAETITRSMRTKPKNLVGQVGLRELAGILSEATMFVCNNSGPMHIAASMKTPTIVLHGPSKTYWDAPYANAGRIVEKEFSCRQRCDETSCHNERYHACMEDITVDDVFSAVTDMKRELDSRC